MDTAEIGQFVGKRSLMMKLRMKQAIPSYRKYFEKSWRFKTVVKVVDINTVKQQKLFPKSEHISCELREGGGGMLQKNGKVSFQQIST